MSTGQVNEQKSSRIPSLDGIRAVSILAVLFAHTYQTANFPRAVMRVPELFLDGKLGVRVFFVISGFLITTLLLKELRQTAGISLSAFYWRRALRILPVYYFYILVIAMVAFFGLRAIPVSTFLSAGSFTSWCWGEWWNPQVWPLQHTWSLSIEEQFYLTWPALLAFLGPKLAGRIWIPLLLLLAPLLRCIWWPNLVAVEQFFFIQGDSIASGCFLALLMERRSGGLLKIFQFHTNFGRAGALLMIYAHLFSASILIHLGLPFPIRLAVAIVPSLQCLCICYLIGSLVMVPSGVGYALLNCAPVQWIGRLSYSLYIWQQIALVPDKIAVFPAHGTALLWLGRFPQNLLFAFTLAALSYYCLEQPMLKLKARFARIPSAN